MSKATEDTRNAGKAALAAQKKSNDELAELQRLAGKTSIELLSTQQEEYAALVEQFQARMKDLNTRDRAEAERLLEQALNNLLLKWANFGTGVIATTKTTKTEVKQAVIDTTLNWELLVP